MRTAAGEVVCFESARSAFLPDERSSNTPKRVHLMNHHPHILNAACNLLGICFIVIGSLKLADLNSRSYGDEAAWQQPHYSLSVSSHRIWLFGITITKNGSSLSQIVLSLLGSLL